MLGILATFLRHRETIIDSLNKSLPANGSEFLKIAVMFYRWGTTVEKSPKDKTRRLFGWFVPGWPF